MAPEGDEATIDGPRRVASLVARRRPLADPAEQLRVLASLRLAGGPTGTARFAADVAASGLPGGLRRGRLEIVQVNVGKLCNMSCAHCHVDAGPDRDEIMDRATMEDVLALVDASGAGTVDITGGAPELNPHFRWLVDECARRGLHVIDRCNLTVLLLPRFADLPEWLAERGVEIACSLPHFRKLNTDAQRGEGTYEKSLVALRRLNAAGYGKGDPRRRLTIVSNPAGAFLAPDQAGAERDWRRHLESSHGITFDRLSCLNNMPIARFLDWLLETGRLEEYMSRLTAAFNPATLAGLMCRNTLSVSWDGRVFDCDFNQMLELPVLLEDGRPARAGDVDPRSLSGRAIATDRHCYGCTAGAGSSCGGAIAAAGA